MVGRFIALRAVIPGAIKGPALPGGHDLAAGTALVSLAFARPIPAVPPELTTLALGASLLSGDSMSQLIVRNLEPEVVQALQRRAAEHGRSAEAEHRDILRRALLVDAKADAFKAWLLSMPNVGDDADFARPTDLPRDVDL